LHGRQKRPVPMAHEDKGGKTMDGPIEAYQVFGGNGLKKGKRRQKNVASPPFLGIKGLKNLAIGPQ